MIGMAPLTCHMTCVKVATFIELQMKLGTLASLVRTANVVLLEQPSTCPSISLNLVLPFASTATTTSCFYSLSLILQPDLYCHHHHHHHHQNYNLDLFLFSKRLSLNPNLSLCFSPWTSEASWSLLQPLTLCSHCGTYICAYIDILTV